jgi:hypothetical protein
MNNVELNKIDRVEQHQRELKKDMQQISDDVKEIKLAIMGNPMTKDDGIVGKIREVVYDLEAQKKEIDALKEDRIINTVYMKMILWFSGIAGAAVIVYVFNQFLK